MQGGEGGSVARNSHLIKAIFRPQVGDSIKNRNTVRDGSSTAPIAVTLLPMLTQWYLCLNDRAYTT